MDNCVAMLYNVEMVVVVVFWGYVCIKLGFYLYGFKLNKKVLVNLCALVLEWISVEIIESQCKSSSILR